MTAPPQRIVAYPPQPLSVAQLGYNVGSFADDAHVALAAAGGASFLRRDFPWEAAENYATGTLALSASQQTFLASCAAHGITPLINALFGPPRSTIGAFTVSAPVAAGSPPGTPIPGTTSAAIVANSTDFAGGVNYTPGPLSAVSAYYGDMITFADAGSIQLAATLTRALVPGDAIQIQRLRYAPAFTDADAAIAAYVRYVAFLAQQIAAVCGQGYVAIWNEFIWAADRFTAPGTFWDVKPGFVTLSGRMKAYLQAAQALALPPGVRLVNGVSDKSGANGIAGQNIPGQNFAYDGIHPYGNNPEQTGWCFYATDSGGWQTLLPTDSSGNFQGMAHTEATKAGGPWPTIMVTENGRPTANDTVQARDLARRVVAFWGMGAPSCVYVLDDNHAVGSNTYSVAPQSTPRASYTALQRLAAVLARMGSVRADVALPAVVGWSFDDVPLLATTVLGAVPGNSVMYLYQRTNVDSNDSANNPWTAIPSPAPRPVSINMPAGLTVAECFDAVTGAAASVTGPTSHVVGVPVADNPVAIRFAPA